MNQRDLLLAQVRATLREIRRLPTILSNEHLQQSLRGRVQAHFNVRIETNEAKLESLMKDLENNGDMAAAWSELQNLRRSIAPLFREFLAFTQGALLRSAGLDDGLCEIGDALANELSDRSGTTWTGLTVMAWEGESYDDMVELIRIRSPEVSIWALPVVAHEFGHFASQSLSERTDGKRYYRFQEYVEKRKAEDPGAARFLDEQFADLFATHTLGPAYACTCTILRFDPTSPFRPGLMHPSADARVYWILKLLEKTDDNAGVVRPYRDVIERLRDAWTANVRAAGQAYQPPDRAPLDQTFRDMFDILDRLVPDDARYQGWIRAQSLARSLDPDTEEDARATTDMTLADVLNAAWLCRLRLPADDPSAVRMIGDRAASVCREILVRGRH